MVIKIAHRGIPVLEVENTLPSFKKAIKLGADMVECDVRLSKDGKVVVIHDHTVDRTTSGKGKVSDFTYKELQKLGVPLLYDVLKLDCKFNVEIKDYRVLNVMELNEDVLFSSDKARILMNIKKKNPKVKTSLVFSSRLLKWLLLHFADVAKVDAVSLHDKLASQKLIDKLHGHNFNVYVYTVNSTERIKELEGFGVEGIFTDDVRLFREQKIKSLRS